MLKYFILFFTAFIPLHYLNAQDIDTLWYRYIDEMLVTATRNERQLSRIALPASVISARQIQTAGLLRLNEVLQEQTGILLTSGTGSAAIGGGVFGNGVQIQGLSPEYTLVMIDGEPIIGRQGGVMDLSRFTVGNIRKIEIIKGPSSALYGSEAMGGVINILTQQKRSNQWDGGLRYGSFHTRDVFSSLNLDHGKSTWFFFGNYFSSNGYDLNPSTPENTFDPFFNLTGQIKWVYRFTDYTKLTWNNRAFYSAQNSAFAINSENINASGRGIVRDFNFNPTLDHRFSDELKTSFRLYTSNYSFNQNLDLIGNKEPYYRDKFKHNFYRIENQTDWEINDKNTFIAGGGFNIQTVETNRYVGLKRQKIGYGFLQNEWRATEKLTVTPGMRFDIHSDFSNRFTPKLSIHYKSDEKLNFRLSYGSGFKAPDFRQLYLYYVNNPTLGYRIYGASEFSITELENQLAEGVIATILPEAYSITQLRPEVSHGINIGSRYTMSSKLTADINIFYNSVQDMINYLPVAVTNSGALVFSYKNINRAFTRGIEANFNGKMNSNFDWSLGYQYLETGDQDILKAIDDGEVFGRNSVFSGARRMTRADYSGLLFRSPHTINCRLNYNLNNSGWSGTTRLIYRSKWGVNDFDGNGFANMPEEFANSFLSINLSVQKEINKNYKLLFGLNNLLNQTDEANLPQNPGMSYFISFQWNFNNLKL